MSQLQHINRNQGSELSMIKQTIQYAFFMVVCIWLLYQIHHSIYVRRVSDCDLIDNKLTDDHITEVLGRKGGVQGRITTSHYTEEVVEEFVSEIFDKKGNLRREGKDDDDEDRKTEMSRENEIDSEMRVNGVILQKGEELEIFKFSDENGVPEYEFERSSRRSEVEDEDYRKGSDLRDVIRTGEMEEILDVCPQNVTTKYSFKKLEEKHLNLLKKV
ncbi:hypothetical protein RND81_08G048900 [Saponaria officinalis]|uniref:Uncharacterized protein n=1 Tax=Saponaria officinalis TaxID=3572 RepID=A0AAW1J3N3_SAPOF